MSEEEKQTVSALATLATLALLTG
ncbi:VENN motif pre-toxin domain-containing protein [Kosakonia sp. YIM B13611]